MPSFTIILPVYVLPALERVSTPVPVFVNGLKPGQLTAALDGAPVGTVIYNADMVGRA